jgi:hypothetical protein
MEMLRFDSRAAAPKFLPIVDDMKQRLLSVPIVGTTNRPLVDQSLLDNVFHQNLTAYNLSTPPPAAGATHAWPMGYRPNWQTALAWRTTNRRRL